MRHRSGVRGGQQLPRESAGVHAQGNRADLYASVRSNQSKFLARKANSDCDSKSTSCINLTVITSDLIYTRVTWSACSFVLFVNCSTLGYYSHTLSSLVSGQMPRIWLDYCQFIVSQCKITRSRRTFDRALRALPVTQHSRIWPLYLKYARKLPLPETSIRVYRRYLKVCVCVWWWCVLSNLLCWKYPLYKYTLPRVCE